MTPARFPHSDPPGSTLGCQLPRAYRRLLRPSSALDAKASTTCPSQLVTHTTNPPPTPPPTPPTQPHPPPPHHHPNQPQGSTKPAGRHGRDRRCTPVTATKKPAHPAQSTRHAHTQTRQHPHHPRPSPRNNTPEKQPEETRALS